MDTDNTQATLRDTLESSFDSVMTDTDSAVVTDAPAAAPATTDAPAATSAPADDRPRRDDGTFAKKPKDSTAAPKATAQTTAPSASVPPAGAVAAPASAARPATWKKELEAHWPGLPAEVQAEILRRENDYAKGVSTYKGEWDRAKPLLDAISPFMPELQQHGIAPDQFITRLATAHRTLALGSQEQKLATFTQLAQQYNIPLAAMFERGQDGQVYLRNTPAPAQQQPQGMTEAQVAQVVEQRLAQQSTSQEIAQFQAAKDDGGNPRYPHFETVKDTMAGLLQAGLADDLAGAYQAALRHPRHAEIFDEQQRLQREADEKKAAAERAKLAQTAKRNAISTPSATPTSTAAAAKGAKGLRAQLEENFDAATASRV